METRPGMETRTAPRRSSFTMGTSRQPSRSTFGHKRTSSLPRDCLEESDLHVLGHSALEACVGAECAERVVFDCGERVGCTRVRDGCTIPSGRGLKRRRRQMQEFIRDEARREEGKPRRDEDASVQLLPP